MIYIDIDGVLADSDGLLKTLDPEALNDTHRLFKAIYKFKDKAFKDSKPLVDLSFVKQLDEFTLLTALPNDRNIDSFTGSDEETKIVMAQLTQNKKDWVKEHIGECNLIILEKRTDKSKYCKFSTDILIDDNKDTGKKWKEAGGIYFSNVSDFLTYKNSDQANMQSIKYDLF